MYKLHEYPSERGMMINYLLDHDFYGNRRALFGKESEKGLFLSKTLPPKVINT